MRLIELHILQSFPVSCLNRDDVGAPKTAVFGGVNRARISSQCLKRAIRLAMKELCPDLCRGERSRLIVDPLVSALQEEFRDSSVLSAQWGEEMASAAEFFARKFCDYLATLDESAEKAKRVRKVKTLMFLSPAERTKAAQGIRIALEKAVNDGGGVLPASLMQAVSGAPEQPGGDAALQSNEPAPAAKGKRAKRETKKKGEESRQLSKILKKAAAAMKDACLADAGDIALFGRMVASDPTLNVEGAAMFSHALSTHRADNDIDFFTAVDDRQQDDPTVADEDRAGSGMMGTLEFTSATYYRYAAVNVDLLADSNHLQAMPERDRKKLLDAFIRAALLAVPSARRNSMNACSLPAFVLGLYRETGHPVQLVNAFEEPVKADGNGFIRKSREALEREFEQFKSVWGIQPRVEVRIPSEGMTLDRFCQEVLQYV
jgi:CRISPR system Cascade subunit CasC